MLYLILETSESTMRATVHGWDCEDTRAVIEGKPIGLSGHGEHPPEYETPLHALADGWELIAPPVVRKTTTRCGGHVETKTFHEWWLRKPTQVPFGI